MNVVIYSPNGALVDGVVGQYRNPDYFEQPEATDKVVVVGDYPHIVRAYEAIGVEVEHHQAQDKVKTSGEAKPKSGRSKQPQVNEQNLPSDEQ